jgi:hypothetical protein
MMCVALNKKSPILGSDRLYRLLKSEYHLVQAKLVVSLKGRQYALTTDAWTSIAKVGYITCTVHFIDHDTWKLHSLVLGLYEKTGQSRAVDCVDCAEQQLQVYNLFYKNVTAVVTDTEATMVSADRLFVQHSIQNQGRTKWHGCVAHLLELVTGIAFVDSPETLGTMSA